MKPIKYIVANERDHQWGLSVCAVGFEEIAPHSPYPTRKHPSGYYFSTEIRFNDVYNSESMSNWHILEGDYEDSCPEGHIISKVTLLHSNE